VKRKEQMGVWIDDIIYYYEWWKLESLYGKGLGGNSTPLAIFQLMMEDACI
jgi:hypothetical protein